MAGRGSGDVVKGCRWIFGSSLNFFKLFRAQMPYFICILRILFSQRHCPKKELVLSQEESKNDGKEEEGKEGEEREG